MSNPFNDIMASDAQFMADAEFGEPVVYTRVGGDQIPGNAIIDRFPAEAIEGAPPNSWRRHYEISLPRSTFTNKPDRGDRIDLPDTQGGTTTIRMNVESIIDHDAGMWHVRLA